MKIVLLIVMGNFELEGLARIVRRQEWFVVPARIVELQIRLEVPARIVELQTRQGVPASIEELQIRLVVPAKVVELQITLEVPAMIVELLHPASLKDTGLQKEAHQDPSFQPLVCVGPDSLVTGSDDLYF